MATTKANVTYKLYNGTDWEIYYFKTTAGSVIESTTKKFLTPEMTINGLKLFDGAIALRAGDIKVSTEFAASHPEYNGHIESVFESFINEHTYFQNSLSTINKKITNELLNKTNIATSITGNETNNDKVSSPSAVYNYIEDYYQNTIIPKINEIVNPTMEFKGVWSTIESLPSEAKKGDTYKLGVSIFTNTHKGDLLIAIKDNPSTDVFTIDDGINWSIIHGEEDTSTTDTWRPIQVNGNNKLLGTISTGALNFKDGTNTTVSFDAGDSGIKIDVDLSDYITTSIFSENNTALNNSISANRNRIAALENRAANKVFVGTSAPTDGMYENDVWIDISSATTVSV